MEVFGTIWNEAIIRPMVNGLVLLYILLFRNLGLSILVFTALTRLATFPLTVRQLRSTRAMSQLQPKIKEIQKKYAGKWIAVHDGAVIGVGDTAPEAIEQAEQKAPGADYILEGVDEKTDVIYGGS